MRYRAHRAILVLAYGDNHDAAVPIPEGEVFTVLGPDQDDRFVIVRFRQENFLVFASDLGESGVPLSTRKTAGASDYSNVQVALSA